MKVRKKPVVVDAVRFMAYATAGFVPGPGSWMYQDANGGGQWFVRAIGGDVEVKPGDWIITGVKGERYPCKPEIFEQTYTIVPDDEAELLEAGADDVRDAFMYPGSAVRDIVARKTAAFERTLNVMREMIDAWYPRAVRAEQALTELGSGFRAGDQARHAYDWSEDRAHAMALKDDALRSALFEDTQTDGLTSWLRDLIAAALRA